MEKTLQKSPTLKLADNIPAIIRFDNTNPKQFHSEQYGTDSFMYFVFVNDVKHVWFATQRQHEVLQERGVHVNAEYTIVKKKLPGDKFPEFLVEERGATLQTNAERVREAMTSPLVDPFLDTPPEHVDGDLLDQYLKGEQGATAHTNSAINTNKRSTTVSRDPQSVAWAIKTAVQTMERYEPGALKQRTEEILTLHAQIMAN